MRSSGRFSEYGRNLGDEAAPDANSVFAELFGPHAFETYANGRQDRHVENGQESVRDAFAACEVQGHAAEAKIHDASTMRGLVAEDCVSVCSGHGNAFGLARNGEDASFLDGERKSGLRGLQRRDRSR